MSEDHSLDVASDSPALDDSSASPSKRLAAAIDAFAGNLPKLARADKKGRFPLAAMKMNEATGSYDMLPFTVAMTEETFERVRDLIGAAIAYRPLLGDGGAQQPSTTEPDAVPGMPSK